MFVNGPDRAELAHVAGMVGYLRANPDHPLADRATELEALAAEMEAALPRVTSAKLALRAAQALEREQRDALFPPVSEAKVAEDESPEV